MRLLLVRHPPPDIAAGICYGRLDVGLHPHSLSLALEMAGQIRVHGPRSVRTSPAARCRILAEAVAAACGAPIVFDDRLRELDFGEWEGVAWDRVPRIALDRWASDPLGFVPPGGECGADLLARTRAVFAALVAAGIDCVVVSHGGPLKLLAALARGAPPDLLAPAPPMGSISVVAVQARTTSTAVSASTDTAPSASPV